MTSSLVGSEMCIRDSRERIQWSVVDSAAIFMDAVKGEMRYVEERYTSSSVSYTHLTLPTICSV
eukprot:2212745-Prorocentrum_lima.AAC.1